MVRNQQHGEPTMKLKNFRLALEKETVVSYELLEKLFDPNFSCYKTLEELINVCDSAGSVIRGVCSWRGTGGRDFLESVAVVLKDITDDTVEGWCKTESRQEKELEVLVKNYIELFNQKYAKQFIDGFKEDPFHAFKYSSDIVEKIAEFELCTSILSLLEEGRPFKEIIRILRKRFLAFSRSQLNSTSATASLVDASLVAAHGKILETIDPAFKGRLD